MSQNQTKKTENTEESEFLFLGGERGGVFLFSMETLIETITGNLLPRRETAYVRTYGHQQIITKNLPIMKYKSADNNDNPCGRPK